MKPWMIIIGVCVATSSALAIYYHAQESPINYDSCIKKYAVTASSQLLERAASAQCKFASDKDATPNQRKQAKCILKSLPEMRSDFGFVPALIQCEKMYPT